MALTRVEIRAAESTLWPTSGLKGQGLLCGRRWQSGEENSWSKVRTPVTPKFTGLRGNERASSQRVEPAEQRQWPRETEGSGWEGKLGQGEDILSVWPSAHQSEAAVEMPRAFVDRDPVSIFEGYFLLPLVFLRSLISLWGHCLQTHSRRHQILHGNCHTRAGRANLGQP